MTVITFDNRLPVISGPRRGGSVNLDTDTAYAEPLIAVWVGVAGDLKVDLADEGMGITFPNVPVGWFTAQITKIYSTANGTTASSLRWAR